MDGKALNPVDDDLNSLKDILSDDDDEVKDSAEKKDEEKKDINIDELAIKKKRKLMKPFNEDLLIGRNGLYKIYQNFPKFLDRAGRKGREGADILKFLTMYKEWAFQLHPGVSFDDVLLKCETLGSKGRVRHHLELMRTEERRRLLVRDRICKSSFVNICH